jgi:hypothetical protein
MANEIDRITASRICLWTCFIVVDCVVSISKSMNCILSFYSCLLSEFEVCDILRLICYVGIKDMVAASISTFYVYYFFEKAVDFKMIPLFLIMHKMINYILIC